MFQIGIIASGSKGNCMVIRGDEGAILLDAGLSGKRIIEGLDQLGISANEIKALVISHEHSDHIKGAGIICRKLELPLFITEETYSTAAKNLGKLKSSVEFFEHGKDFKIKDICISTFASSHDAVEGSNFVFWQKGNKNCKLGVATDCGYFTRLMNERLQNCSTLVLESNHDEVMLIEGRYRWELKQRVKSRQGHLSNRQAVGVISQVIHPGLKQLILAHLSEENNTPELAEREMENYLTMINFDLDLFVASQHKVLNLLDI